MKVLLFILECVDDESNCSSNTKKILGFGFYLVLYPILIIWNVVGIVWFINIQNMYNNECKVQIEQDSWIILMWITINCFLTIIYLITSISIIIEWCKEFRMRIRSDMSVYLNENQSAIDRHGNEDQEHGKSNPDENDNLKKFVISRDAIHFFIKNYSNCSICFEKMENNEKIVMLPKCFHLFHLRLIFLLVSCLSEWISRQLSCPNCRISLELN